MFIIYVKANENLQKMLMVEMASIIWEKMYVKLGNYLGLAVCSALERLSAFLHTAARGSVKFTLSKWPVLPPPQFLSLSQTIIWGFI